MTSDWRCALIDAMTPDDRSSSVIRHSSLVIAAARSEARGVQPPEGRFIWQLVGVLETYGSICLIGTKV